MERPNVSFKSKPNFYLMKTIGSGSFGFVYLVADRYDSDDSDAIWLDKFFCFNFRIFFFLIYVYFII